MNKNDYTDSKTSSALVKRNTRLSSKSIVIVQQGVRLQPLVRAARKSYHFGFWILDFGLGTSYSSTPYPLP
ncbi:hypothetical protein, partial [Scytonema sp. UIC 10036]|uniref:hypothetical protein n=1 Tax=Scytonema sp. UIC 10036 TaxID=2304196 RepID=UPI001A9AD457